MRELNNEWLQEIARNVFRHLRSLGASPEDAEDIVQDALYKALLYMEAIEDGKFSAWLYKVATNRYYDLCRRNKRITWVEEELLAEETVEEALIQKERREAVAETLSHLKVEQRNLLLLKYEHDLSYREIGEQLSMKQETVKTYLARARRQFEKLYWRYWK